jgi:HEAT repeat protein
VENRYLLRYSGCEVEEREMKRSFAPVLVLLVMVSGLLVAQPDEGRSTVEERFLQQQIEIQILRSQAASNDRESKLYALETVRSMYEAGDVQASEQLFDVIERLATEGVANQVRQGGRVINNYPIVRKEAAALLGEIGGPGAQEVLLRVVREDPEPMVLAEAVYALGRIGPTNADVVANHIVFTLTRENARISPDNNLAMAALLSLEQLFADGMEFEDPGQLQDTVGLIIDISTNYSYITIVRNKARDVLDQLTGQ